MKLDFRVDPNLDIPIYQQLVDTIRFAARKGDLAPGQKLPTVQELSQGLGIARGTIKRAYDELERMGLVEKVQGRGTFLRGETEPTGSRKERAMTAIDGLFRELEEMGLTMTEIQIFVGLRLRQLSEEETAVRVAVIECNHENLNYMSEQLRHIPGVDLYSYLLENIQQYPYKLEENFDLVVTTAAHAEYLAGILPAKTRIARVALRPATMFLHEVIKLKPGKRLGILGYSQRYASLLHATCQTFAEELVLFSPAVFSPELDLSAYLRDKDVVLVPKGYEKMMGAEAAAGLKDFAGQIIECHYVMDEGSLLYLEAKIEHLLEEKNI